MWAHTCIAASPMCYSITSMYDWNYAWLFIICIYPLKVRFQISPSKKSVIHNLVVCDPDNVIEQSNANYFVMFSTTKHTAWISTRYELYLKVQNCPNQRLIYNCYRCICIFQQWKDLTDQASCLVFTSLLVKYHVTQVWLKNRVSLSDLTIKMRHPFLIFLSRTPSCHVNLWCPSSSCS